MKTNEDWIFERSSGYAGYRHNSTGEWLYEEDFFKLLSGEKDKFISFDGTNELFVEKELNWEELENSGLDKPLKLIEEPNLINDWLIKKGDPEIAKQVEQEAEEQEMLEDIFTEIDDKLVRYSTEESVFWKHYKIGVLDGLRWQQERMYSEEDMINILVEFSAEIKNINNITEWFEQFKKGSDEDN